MEERRVVHPEAFVFSGQELRLPRGGGRAGECGDIKKF
jgi:hypothetical protein